MKNHKKLRQQPQLDNRRTNQSKRSYCPKNERESFKKVIFKKFNNIDRLEFDKNNTKNIYYILKKLHEDKNKKEIDNFLMKDLLNFKKKK